jgi:hypothetical protein
MHLDPWAYSGSKMNNLPQKWFIWLRALAHALEKVMKEKKAKTRN